MKRAKKIIAIMLSIVMLLALNVSENITITNVSAAATFEITSPTAGSLKAAGYFDIKWTDASSLNTVSKYNVYVDGSLVATTSSLTYEYYTTKVNYHTTWIEAIFTDGTKTTTPSVRFGVTKKGICVNTDMARNLFPNELKAGWYYNWGSTPFTKLGYEGVEYVPMLWNGYDFNANLANAKKSESKYVLGFNEPDYVKQANMTVAQAISLWPSLMNIGKRVGSPATVTWPSSNTKWFQPFMNQLSANNLDVDFITIHCYPDDWNGGKSMAEWFLETVVDSAWEMYHKPIWITEFSTSGNGITQAGTKSFIEYLLPELDEREYVERYSFFSFDKADFEGGLWWYSTGALTDAGKAYRDNGNPTTDYKAGNAVNNYTTYIRKTASTTVKKPAKVKIKSIKNVKKKKIRLTLKKIKTAAGYQIRWSDNKKFKGYWQKTTKKTKYTIKGLDKNTRYYVKVRAYVKNGNKKLYGSWSKKKSVKIKK